MDWVLVASILAGFAVGFSTGASPTPTGGALSASVVAFVAGVVGGASRASGLNNPVAQDAGFLVVLFIGTMLVTYIAANVMRRRNMFEWMGIRGPGRRK